MFEELLPRVASIEPTGPARRMRIQLHERLKAMPVRARRGVRGFPTPHPGGRTR